MKGIRGVIALTLCVAFGPTAWAQSEPGRLARGPADRGASPVNGTTATGSQPTRQAFRSIAEDVAGSLRSETAAHTQAADERDEIAQTGHLSSCPSCHSAACAANAGGCSCGANCPCDESCGCCNDCCDERLFGLFARTDHCYDDFISPLTNPFFFEDPRTLTEIREIYINHWTPGNNPLFTGGQVQMIATQLRAAITDRLSLISTKSGYLWIDRDSDLVPRSNGWADMNAGLKYNLFRDPYSQMVLSFGTTYEFDFGAHKVLQGHGDGEIHAFLTGGTALPIGRSHWLSAMGVRLPMDKADRTQMWYWSNHWDYEVTDGLYGVLELNWFRWLSNGNRFPAANFEGGDLFNLGSGNVTGNDVVTMGVGGRAKPTDNTEVGIAYEIPLTNRKDVMQSRLYVDFILRY